MSAISMGCTQSNSNGWFIKFLGLIFIAIMSCILYSVCEHALEKHGEVAAQIDSCLEQKGKQWGIWQRKSDGHLAFPCLLDTGKWGIKIDKCNGENCTSMPKEKFSKVCQIVRYLKNTGYEPVDTIAMNLWELYIVSAQALCDW
jgi:hypothetical protein